MVKINENEALISKNELGTLFGVAMALILDPYDVATHFSCPIITLVVCHRINRYNDMGTEKGKGFRTLIFCTELSPETITKTMVIISKYEVEYKETEDIFNRQ